MKVLRGKTESGIVDFGQWVEKLRAYYERKTEMKLYPEVKAMLLIARTTCVAGIALLIYVLFHYAR
jgi:hypothetical protein